MLSIALPVMLGSFLQTLYNLTDTYWLGQIGTEPLAAINLVTPVQNVVTSFGSGLTVAGAVMIGQYVGAGKKEEAAGLLSQIFTCAIGFAAVCALLISLLSRPLVAALGADGAVLDHGAAYLGLVVLDMPLVFAGSVFQASRQAQGDTLRPVLLNLSGIAANLVLDPLLMVYFHLGATGAALATVIAKLIPAVLAMIHLLNPEEIIRLRRGAMRPRAAQIREIVRIGFPTALGGSVMQLGFLLMSRNVYAYGAQAMAAYGIGNKINGLISMPSSAAGSAVSTIVAQNIGAGQRDRAWKGYVRTARIMTALLFAGGLLLSRLWAAGAIVRVFSQDASVIAMATDYLSLMAFWCWVNALHDSSMGLFQGTGHTEITMAVNIARLWIFRMGTLWLFENLLHQGVGSIWLCVVVSNGLAAALLMILVASGIWKKNRVKLT